MRLHGAGGREVRHWATLIVACEVTSEAKVREVRHCATWMGASEVTSEAMKDYEVLKHYMASGDLPLPVFDHYTYLYCFPNDCRLRIDKGPRHIILKVCFQTFDKINMD